MLANWFIKWPKDAHAIRTVKGFQLRCGFPGVIGAIDGSHIPISKPKFMPNSYINRKKFPSIVLQGVCDHNYMFTDCFCGK